MIDMLQNAKDLIAKGKTLGDPDLIQMGMDLLEQYSPTEMAEAIEENGGFREVSKTMEPQYVCENCGHTMPVDKERKRCPECKKHKLKINKPDPLPKPEKPSYDELLQALEEQQSGRAPTSNSFEMKIRGDSNSRIHYDDEGNPDGIIRKREQVDTSQIKNIWEDDGEYKDDAANELLKKFTKVSPRTRAPVNYVTVQCQLCNKTEKVHPIHAGGRGRHLCEACVRRRSRR